MKSLASRPDLAEICGRVKTLSEEDSRRWGAMSVHATVCHLREAYRMALEAPAARVKMGPLPGGVLKWFAFWFPAPWPKGVPTIPELKLGAPRLAETEFAEDKAGLVDWLDRFAAEGENRREHPIFGTMQPEDWLRWGYLHADHHLRQFGR